MPLSHTEVHWPAVGAPPLSCPGDSSSPLGNAFPHHVPVQECVRTVHPLVQQPALLLSDDPTPQQTCGLDEVGRGALAGPLVAAGVILPDDFAARLGPLIRFLRDSKTVPPTRRAELAEHIQNYALAVEVVAIPVELINTKGIGWANREAFYQLITRIAADEYIVDGRVRPHAPPGRSQRVRCLVKADEQVPAVSAASLVAKVHRDTLMRNLHVRHPAFGWDTNVGYGTRAHLAALRLHGPSPLHRSAFVTTALRETAASAEDGQPLDTTGDIMDGAD